MRTTGRRAARARSARTATVAASRAVPTAIRAICQPGIPPATMVRYWIWAGTEAGATDPSPPGGTGTMANAGVATRTVAASVARTAVIRRM